MNNTHVTLVTNWPTTIQHSMSSLNHNKHRDENHKKLIRKYPCQGVFKISNNSFSSMQMRNHWGLRELAKVFHSKTNIWTGNVEMNEAPSGIRDKRAIDRKSES